MKSLSSIAFMATVVAAKNLGCYSSLPVPDGSNQSTYDFNSYGSCQSVCSVSSHKYTALSGTKCTCVHDLPPASALVGDDQCNQPCPGFTSDVCGGAEGSAWTILDTEPEKNHPSNLPATPSIISISSGSIVLTQSASSTATTPASSTTVVSTSSTTASTSIPTAAAVAGSAYLGGVAAVAGLGAVVNIL